MEIPKKYFHDRVVLLLLSSHAFLVILNTILILLRLDSSRTDSYIVQYRANLGLGAFQAGSSLTFFAFIVFLTLVFAIHLGLSLRIYEARRRYALTILGLGVLLAVLTLIVSNALLVLR